jgi:hypothetical protein
MLLITDHGVDLPELMERVTRIELASGEPGNHPRSAR